MAIRLQPLCRFWAVAFLVTGLCFAIAPREIARLLDGLAAMLGLAYGIPTERLSLWYPLALSLMATITYLAWEAGRTNAPPVALRALVLSKLVSTAGFALLAIGVASGWWLAAATDGFIALTLLWAAGMERRRVS